jgi:hypothetical protein
MSFWGWAQIALSMMSITPFPNGMNFDQETTRVMGVAIEMVCATLRTGDCDDRPVNAILINCAKKH